MKPDHKPRIFQAVFILTVAAFAAGCGKKNVVPAKAAVEPPGVRDAAPGAGDADGEASLRDKEYRADPGLKTVHFDYDKAELGTEEREVLRANAAALKKMPSAEILVAGHCDERGTNPYNLALGQRRANAVRDYYKFLGVKMGRMSTLSYGEESPACAGSTEECWSLNRRAETLVRRK